MLNLENWFLGRYGGEIGERAAEHLLLVAIAMVAALALGLPLGILITRRPRLAAPILGLANGVQTIPSLAIFGFLLSVPLLGGVGKVPAIVALSLYALLPIIRNTYTGIMNVDPAIREAGRGMGMGDRQLLWQVEIPLALSVILAGVRVAAVISVGIATIAAAIGGGGLGVFIFRGISTVDNELLLAGAIPAAVLALAADRFLGGVEQFWQRRQRGERGMTGAAWVQLGILALLLLGLSAILLPQPQQATEGGKIAIGSKNFTEQAILGEILAQQIEASTDLTVDRRFYLGGTFICHEAVKTGDIAGYVEYTGTAFTGVLNQPPIGDPQAVFRQVKQAYDEKFQLEVFPGLGFENTFALAIRREDAEKWSLSTLSEAARYAPQWRAGFGTEFLNREDGYPGLAKTYELKFAGPPQEMDLGLIYRALQQKQVDIVAGSSTDGAIAALNLVILRDDRQYFPPYEAVPIFNQEILRQYPQLSRAISQLSGRISAEEMQQMNLQIDQQSRPLAEVARQFLQAEGLLP